MERRRGRGLVFMPMTPDRLHCAGLPRERSKTGRGFTLIELLTVIAIMGLLMLLILGAAVFAKRSAMRSRAKAKMQEIQTALLEHKLANGSYPADESGALNYDPLRMWLEGKNMLYTNRVTMRGTEIAYARDVLVDPWFHPFVYSYSSERSETYSLYCEGENLAITADDLYPGK